MCGITGMIAHAGTLPENATQTVARMNAALTHRGPDAEGAYNNQHCALAMRRLSIIDLEGGHQPLWNETRDVLVFQNGELYNYLELRETLEAKGHQFATQSDTEVLVHLYEAYGTDMLPMLKGMFAFCLYDQRTQQFLLARDRFGEKPLFYHHANGALSFSSELASLLQNPAVPRVLNREALPYYFRTSLLPEPLTMFRDVHSLPPGHYMVMKDGHVATAPYHTIDYPVDSTIAGIDEAVELIRPLLRQAVKRQAVSDVPLGCFLSGGIDSSTVVALLQQQSSTPIPTFNVKFEQQGYDESPIARAVAQHLGTEHHEVVIPNQEFTPDIFWQIIAHVGQPFRDSSAIPTALISKEIGQHVRVALSGDGGDELFGGYAMFQWYTKILKAQRIPKPLRAMAGGATGIMQQSGLLDGNSRLRQLHRAFDTSMLSEAEVAIALNEQFTKAEMARVLGAANHDLPLLKAYPPAASSWSPLRKIMYYRSIHTLPANMLVKVDRMSMAHSLEVRAPFLDPDLFAAAATLPDHCLVRDGLGKILLREVMKEALPAEVFNHPKQGFNLPLHGYRNQAFRTLAQQLLFDENPWPGYFPETELNAIFKRGMEQQEDTSTMSVFRASHQLWMLMQLLGWAKHFNVAAA